MLVAPLQDCLNLRAFFSVYVGFSPVCSATVFKVRGFYFCISLTIFYFRFGNNSIDFFFLSIVTTVILISATYITSMQYLRCLPRPCPQPAYSISARTAYHLENKTIHSIKNC